MALTELEKNQIENLFADYCAKKIPAQYHSELRVEFEIKGNEVYLLECRSPWRGEGDWTRMKVARFKKDSKTETWLLYWADRNSKWRQYPPFPFHARIEKLLAVVEKNENGAFWG